MRLTGFGVVLLLMAVAVAVLALIGQDTAAWIVAIVELLLLGATFMSKSARADAMDSGFSARNWHR